MNKNNFVLELNQYELANLIGLFVAITTSYVPGSKQINVLQSCQTGDWTAQIMHKCDIVAKDQLTVSPNLTPEYLINMVHKKGFDWATQPYKEEEEKLKILMEKYPAIKKAKEQLDLLIKLVEKNGTAS